MIVKTKVKSPLDLMDEKYADLYRGAKGGRMYDIMNDPSATSSKNPLNYLLTWKLPARFLHQAFKIYINEIAVPYPQLRSLRMDQIAFVKYVPEDFLEPFHSGVYIYLKNDDDYFAEAQKKMNARLKTTKIPGYTAVKEFYHPDYSVPENLASKRTDIQTTVFWQPEIIGDPASGNIRIVFYNNDIPGKLKIVVEGINEIGQLTRVEKLME